MSKQEKIDKLRGAFADLPDQATTRMFLNTLSEHADLARIEALIGELVGGIRGDCKGDQVLALCYTLGIVLADVHVGATDGVIAAVVELLRGAVEQIREGGEHGNLH
jgi:hypothetical protein